MKKALLAAFACILTSGVTGQSATFNTTLVSNCGCPGELWNFSTPYKPWVSLPTVTNSKRLMHTGYGFNIPATASITGVKVEFSYTGTNVTPGSLKDSVVALLLAGTPNGFDKAPTTPTYGTSGNVTVGGPGDTWGMALTPAHINDPGFGFNFKLYNTSPGIIFTFESGAAITVYYNTAAGISESQRSSAGLRAYYAERSLKAELEQSGKIDCEIFDLTGKRVYKNTLEGSKVQFDVSGLHTGIYLYSLRSGDKSRVARMIITD